MVNDNKSIARRVREEVWNDKNFGLANEIISHDCLHHVHDPLTPEVGTGAAGLKKLVELYLNAFPDARCVVEEVIAEGDSVCVRWSVTATHTGALLHVPPTGKSVSIGGVDMYRFANGKIQESRIFWDAMRFAQQLGIS